MFKPFAELLQVVRPKLLGLEQFRQQQYRLWLIWWGAMIAFAAVFIVGSCILFASLGNETGKTLLVGGFLTAAAGSAAMWYFGICRAKTHYVARFKHEFVKPVAEGMLDEAVYEPQGFIPKEWYDWSGLYRERVDEYHGEDLLEGRLGETDFSMCELKVIRIEQRDDNKKKKVPIFKGLFLMADFHKKINSRTYVRPAARGLSLGLLGKTLTNWTLSDGEQVVSLEDPEFEKAFQVISTDQVDARYVLSTAMMRRMLDLKASFKSPVAFSFLGSHMFVAISLKGNLFEPQIRRNVLDEEKLQQYYNQLAACLEIVNDLGMNVRIWGR